jgi:uncharacterized protein YecE (DUF72 family)
MNAEIIVGCSGFQKSHKVYYEHFKTVEIQQTFYKPPMVKTAERWRQEAPDNFIFTIKAWQIITHEPTSPTYKRLNQPIPPGEWKDYGSFKPTQVVHDAWLTTKTIAKALHSPVILFQCPAQFNPTPDHVANFRGFINSINREDFLLAWEPRGFWPDELVKKLCIELNLIHAVDPFLNLPQTPQLAYFRLHGGKDYSHLYSDDELKALYKKCNDFDFVYCYFNNVHMWNDGLRMERLIQLDH